jgi:hypothetical protein
MTDYKLSASLRGHEDDVSAFHPGSLLLRADPLLLCIELFYIPSHFVLIYLSI